MNRFAPLLAATLLAASCSSLIDVNLFVVGEQTALEKQVLGTYSALGEDLLVYSSVRGVNPDGAIVSPPPATESQRAAFAAMRNRDYNRDDVQQLLASGLFGEGADGMLVSRDGARGAAPISDAEILQVVAEENADRETVLSRLLETSGAAAERRADVVAIFAGINRDAAPDGAWIQTRDGGWTRK